MFPTFPPASTAAAWRGMAFGPTGRASDDRGHERAVESRTARYRIPGPLHTGAQRDLDIPVDWRFYGGCSVEERSIRMPGSQAMVGYIAGARGPAPERFAAERTCKVAGCRTRLSVYNGRDTCFLHTPARYPRNRGRAVADVPGSSGTVSPGTRSSWR